MRIISIVVLLAIWVGAVPVQAAEENANTYIKIEIKGNILNNFVAFLTQGATVKPAEARVEIQKQEPETAEIEELKSPEEIKRETIMSRWKSKQEHLWKNLPQGKFVVNASAYTAAADECGKSDGIAASGLKVREKHTIACPPQFPFGAKIRIAGMGTYVCEDRGGTIKGNKIDIYMHTKKEAFAFGRRNLEAEVVM